MKRIRSFFSLLVRLRTNNAGVAAVEFAFIFPVLTVLYLGTVEVASAVNMHRKVQRVAANLSDLLARETELTPQEIDEIFEVGRSILYPNDASGLAIEVAGLRQKDLDQPRVEWSRSDSSDDQELSEMLSSFDYELSGNDDAFLVLVKVTYDYTTFGNYQFIEPIEMTGLAAAKARLTSNLTCVGC